MLNNIELKIKKILLDKGINAKDLAYKIGMSANGYSQMMSNKSIKLATLEKICEVLDTPIQFFLDENYKNDSSINIVQEGREQYNTNKIKQNNFNSEGGNEQPPRNWEELTKALYEKIKDKEEVIMALRDTLKLKDELLRNCREEMERMKKDKLGLDGD